MPEPTDHEVNVRLAEFMGEKVYGCFAPDNSTGACLNMATFTIRCQYCDHGYKKRTESLDLVRGVIHKIEKEHLYEEYVNHLYQGVFKLSESPILEIVELNLSDTFLLVNATANQRARACLKVIEEVGK